MWCSPATSLVDMFQAQKERFREKFGRDPGPGDPVIFDLDPDADEPRPLDVDKAMAEMLAGLPDDTPPYVRAVLETMAEVGYLITEENRHTFSAQEIAVWESARGHPSDKRWRATAGHATTEAASGGLPVPDPAAA
jgi:hypothetical protein